MLKISKGKPWIFWPSSICDTFPTNPSNKLLTGDSYFKVEIEGKILEQSDDPQTLFCILPEYTGLNIHDGKLNFTLTYNTGAEYYNLPFTIKDNFKIVIEHIPYSSFTIFINEYKETYKLSKSKSFGLSQNPHIIFGAGNFPKNGFNLNYTNFNLNSFKIKDENGLTTNHDFKEFIHDKSVDKTGNCNFIHKI